MAAPIPPMLKYSIVYNLFNFPPILIKFVSKFIVCEILYFKALYHLRVPFNAVKTNDYLLRLLLMPASEVEDHHYL